MSSQLPWFVARSAGLVSWALLTASVVWGLLLSTKVSAGGRKPRPAWTLDLHRFMGGLATIFVGLHVGALLLDTYTRFGLADVLVPFAAAWHPVAVAWGVVGLYVLLAVELTSLARRRLPRKVWRTTHLLAFPLFALATVHSLSAGTDTTTTLCLGLGTAASVVVGGLTALRLSVRKPVRGEAVAT